MTTGAAEKSLHSVSMDFAGFETHRLNVYIKEPDTNICAAFIIVADHCHIIKNLQYGSNLDIVYKALSTIVRVSYSGGGGGSVPPHPPPPQSFFLDETLIVHVVTHVGIRTYDDV